MPNLLDLRDIRQDHDHDCGVAAFHTITDYLLERRPTLSADPMDGLHPFELEAALRKTGLRTISGSMTLADLAHHQRLFRPVACLIRTPYGGHWVVSRGTTPSRVYVQDPDRGRVWFARKQWQADWWDLDRFATVFRSHGIAVWAD